MIKIKESYENNDERMINFCKSIFDCYDIYKVNGHIPRPDEKNKE